MSVIPSLSIDSLKFNLQAGLQIIVVTIAYCLYKYCQAKTEIAERWQTVDRSSLVGSMLLILQYTVLLFCFVFLLVCFVFASSICVLCQMLPESLDCPILIVHSVFFNERRCVKTTNYFWFFLQRHKYLANYGLIVDVTYFCITIPYPLSLTSIQQQRDDERPCPGRRLETILKKIANDLQHVSDFSGYSGFIHQ